jgi:hypothetical protein
MVFFIATPSFFLAEKLLSVIMTGVESRYFLRINAHPLFILTNVLARRELQRMCCYGKLGEANDFQIGPLTYLC